MHVRVFLPEYIHNRSPGLRENTPQENIPPHLTVGGPMDRLPQLYRKHGAVEAARQAILLFFFASLDADLPSPALHQRTPHQVCIYTPILEV